MSTRAKRLALILIGLGALSVLLLALVIVMDPINTSLSVLYRDLHEGGGTTFGEFLGAAVITLLILTIPSSHIALLVMAAIWLGRPRGSSESGPRSHCPECGRAVRPDWRVCPYCASDLFEGDEE
ncbi:MAG: zinc ribbon domain-containing protein [Chloroflexi bacterium]|nr:zinc ribbon domain-containing protein [Chloroflexota bacterium]